jgi:hypothetical protein
MVILEGLLRRKRETCRSLPFSGFVGSDLTPCCYLNNCKPRLLRPVHAHRTFISKKHLRHVCCCTNLDREDAELNCKAPPIIIDASGFHPLLVNSADAIQSQHAEKSSQITKKVEPPSLDTGTRKTRTRRLKDRTRTCLRCTKIDPYAWHDWPGRRSPFLPSLILSTFSIST